MTEMKMLPCPFCGGEAEIVHIEEGEDAGGSCVSCTKCQASGNLEFGFKENFVSNWNRRAASPQPPAREGVDFPADASELVQVAWCCKAAIERVALWRDDEHLVTAHCHADVLLQDLPAALRARTSEPEAGAVDPSDRAYVLGALKAGVATLRSLGVTEGARIGMMNAAIDRLSRLDHPAPASADRLRVAVEALEKAASVFDIYEDANEAAAARKALAALNEGGKG